MKLPQSLYLRFEQTQYSLILLILKPQTNMNLYQQASV